MIEPLKGIRVIDMCRSYPPALAAMLMADFGADVIKIDPVGHINPLPLITTEEQFAAYNSIDRNKRSLRLNLRTNAGKEIMFKLAKTADVLIENSRPGTMERLGIGYERLKQINPGLIFAAVSGYGQTGPYRDLVGHDSNFMGVSGALSIIGPKDGPPCWPSNMVADMAGAGLHPLLGVLIALIARDKTGKGQLVDISYTDSVFGLIGFDIMFYLLTKEPRRRGKTLQTGSEPCAAVYQTKDGEYITIQFIEPQFWKNFCQAVGKPELINRQWAASDKDRTEMFNILTELFLTKTRDEWWQWSKDKQVMLAPVLYIEEAIDDPQMRARGMVMELNHPTQGKVLQVGNPLKLSETPPTFKHFSPLPGQNTDEILNELGFKSNEIEEYRKGKIVE